MSRPFVTAWRAATWVGSVAALALTAHTVVNLRVLRTPPTVPGPVGERVSVLVPARDEERQIACCVRRLLAQRHVPDLEVIVLDDESTDGTARAVLAAAAGDPRLRLLRGSAPPSGWLGKAHACAQLAEAATGSVLVFVDADVRLEPDAVAATVEQLRTSGLDLACPYPRQVAETSAERLVQPLLQWSWLTTLPLRLAERSPRPSLTAANGQLLAVDAGAYARAGGHRGVRAQVLDDLALARAVKGCGGRGGVTDGTRLASCRMYGDWNALREGYTKSLWAAFGSPAGAVGVMATLVTVYVLPAAAALAGSRVGLVGYAAGVAGRVLTARRTGGRWWPDALAHPASVLTLCYLTTRSVVGMRRGTLRWKGRSLPAPPANGPRGDSTANLNG